MHLSHALRIQPKDVVAFVGGGGKTTAMFRLADELVIQGRRVVTTTTTRIFAAQIKLAPFHIRSPRDSSEMIRAPLNKGGRGGAFLSRVRAELVAHPHILITGETNEDGRRSPELADPGRSERESGGEKAFGVLPELVDELIELDEVDAVLYEADGSRMRPFKAPASHEPMLSERTTILVSVVGIGALGANLDDEHVHRAEIVAQLTGAKIGERVTADMIARVIANREGGLKNKPRSARAIVLVNAVESSEQLESAREIARLALASDEVEGVAIGTARDENPIRETHRRVAASITAAGAGVRMQGRIKQLLPWRGKTLIENAVEIAMRSNVNETIVVLGAHAEEIRQVIREPRVRIVVNRDWESGHASSIHAALEAIAPTMDAAIFINVDQPLLTPTVVNGIIQRYNETDAEIIAPTYAGKRGSPVLFRRIHFDELRSLHGEQGGRELLAKYADRIVQVAFEDARLGVDVDTVEEYERVRGSEQ